METVARTNEVERNIMREILFKAKRVDNGEWVEGLLTVMWGQYHMINPNDENTAYPIDTETICQYTGLTDKNGNKIWENDIISFEDTGEDGYEYKEGFKFQNRASVVFRKGRWELSDFLSDNSYALDNMNDHEELFTLYRYAEVIGNVFDNPELLEE